MRYIHIDAVVMIKDADRHVTLSPEKQKVYVKGVGVDEHRYYFDIHQFFAYTVYDTDKKIDGVSHLIEELMLFNLSINIADAELIYDQIVNSDDENQAIQKYGDNSSEAVLARKVLSKSGHMSKAEFTTRAFDIGIKNGHSRGVIQSCINNYA